ncbi:MAG: RNA 3'-terminal phosphate cyclase [archaeon]|nr:MAG: RNA 3'-terminal phosphate cyclase [archaeon]
MIDVDGSYLEGGGQILRTSLALSAVTGNPCRIFNIRKGRPKPGLKPQHQKAVETVARICNAQVKGNRIGSVKVEFIPGSITGGKFDVDIGTAGSITLLLHALIPPLLHANQDSEINLTGGTNVLWSPTTDFFRHVFCSFIDRMGVNIRMDVRKHGFYPRGGGKVRLRIQPNTKLKTLSLTRRGRMERIDIWSISSKDLKEKRVAERQLEAFREVLRVKGHEHLVYVDALSTGTSVHAHAHYSNTKLGADFLGERGKPAEKIGRECALLLKGQMDSGACLDKWMADQILPYMALAGGDRIYVAEVTDHCRSNMWVIEKFLPVKFTTEENIISCKKIK